MFAHIAEETTRLSHGFLGAMLAVAVVAYPSDFYSILALALILYLCFIGNSLALHLANKFILKGHRGSFMGSALFLGFVLVILIGTIAEYGFDFPAPVGLSDYAKPPLRFALSVYLVFWFFFNIAHWHVVVASTSRPQARSLIGE